MDKFSERHKLLKLTQQDTENITNLQQRHWISNFQTFQKEKPRPDAFIGNSTNLLKKN